VSGPKTEIVPVYLYNEDKHVGYGVFAVNGTYRATNMFPGHYSITVQNFYVPSKIDLEMAPVPVDLAAGGHVTANLAPKSAPPTRNYTGREIYRDGVVVKTYEEIYPPGPGRKIAEKTCIVCHGVNFLPSKTAARETWESLLHLMIDKQSEGGLFQSTLAEGPPIVSEERLPRNEVPVLLDYLAANFGPDAKQRAVLQDVWPTLDGAALAKAEYIEYRVPNAPGQGRKRASHDVHFGLDGMVYLSDSGGNRIVQVNPETAETKDFQVPDKNGTHGITVDGDGTVWFSGNGNFVTHLDPKTGLFDQYQDVQMGLHGNTPVFDSKGDIWFTELTGNKIGHWDRATDKITYWESPVAGADPYGEDIDHQGNVWYAEYFTGAMTRFDPKTQTFTRFKVPTWPNSLRRGGPDSKDNIWFGVYGYMGKYDEQGKIHYYGKLGHIDVKTGQVTERDLPIEYSQPYDAKPDEQDNVWISSMNYLTKFDPKTQKFTIYPMAERTDAPKIEPTRDGSVWYAPRTAGNAGYGSSASVLYPDKDAIKTLRAIPGPDLSNNYISKYKGPFTPVTGVVKTTKLGAQNPTVAYNDLTVGKTRKAGAQGNQRPANARQLEDQ
jgi:virginiamycin B lyase